MAKYGEVVDKTVWVPNGLSASCDLGILVDRAPESFATSEARVVR